MGKKSEKMKKVLAWIMAVSLCMNGMNLPAMADGEPLTATVNIETSVGEVPAEQTTTTDEVVNEDTSITTTESTDVSTNGSVEVDDGGDDNPETGTSVSYNEYTETSVTTTPEGDLLEEKGSSGGGESVREVKVSEGAPVEEEIPFDPENNKLEVNFDENSQENGEGQLQESDESNVNYTPPEGYKQALDEDGNPIVGVYEKNESSYQDNGGSEKAIDLNGDGVADGMEYSGSGTTTETESTQIVEIPERRLDATLEGGESIENQGPVTEGSETAIDGVNLPTPTAGSIISEEGSSVTETNITREAISEENQKQIAGIEEQLCFDDNVPDYGLTDDNGAAVSVDAAAAQEATQLVLAALLNKEDPKTSENAVVNQLVEKMLADAAEAAKEETPSNPDALPLPGEEPAVVVSNVTLSVGGKSDNEKHKEANEDENRDNDVYDAGVKFDVTIRQSILVNQLFVVVTQGEKVVGSTYVDKNSIENGKCSVELKDIQLQEGVGVNLNIKLDGVEKLDDKQMYVYTTTAETSTVVDTSSIVYETVEDPNF